MHLSIEHRNVLHHVQTSTKRSPLAWCTVHPNIRAHVTDLERMGYLETKKGSDGAHYCRPTLLGSLKASSSQ